MALQIGIQIADALAAAHQRGIVHRDLKPGNVMLTKPATGPTSVPHIKLLDFGLAKTAAPVVTAPHSLAATTPPMAVTAPGAILGTIQYMAPEQIEGGAVDARSDLFAFGSVLYEMLTRRKAFEGKTQASVMVRFGTSRPCQSRAIPTSLRLRIWRARRQDWNCCCSSDRVREATPDRSRIGISATWPRRHWTWPPSWRACPP